MIGNGVNCPDCGRKLVWEHDPNGDSFGFCKKCDEITDNTCGDPLPHPKHPWRKAMAAELKAGAGELKKILTILSGMGFEQANAADRPWLEEGVEGLWQATEDLHTEILDALRDVKAGVPS